MSVRCVSLFCLSLVTLTPAQAAEPARLFVLAVGINAYPAKERLNYAVKDARDVAQALRTKGRNIYRDVEVKLLTDREADRQAILDGVAWLQREVTVQDMAIIYYSGHGSKHPAVGFFLVPAQFQDARPMQTMVSGAELKRAAQQVRGPVVLVLDCCYAGAILDDRPPTPRLRPVALASRLTGSVDRTDTAPGLAFLCAARAREESREGRALQHGTFTKVMLQALSGKAGRNGDGVITLGQVERFVKQRLPKVSRGQQHALSARFGVEPTTPLARP